MSRTMRRAEESHAHACFVVARRLRFGRDDLMQAPLLALGGSVACGGDLMQAPLLALGGSVACGHPPLPHARRLCLGTGPDPCVDPRETEFALMTFLSLLGSRS